MFLWKCQIFWDRKCPDLRGTRIPNLRIHAEYSNHLRYQGQTFACAGNSSRFRHPKGCSCESVKIVYWHRYVCTYLYGIYITKTKHHVIYPYSLELSRIDHWTMADPNADVFSKPGYFNSFFPGRFYWNFIYVISKLILGIVGWGIP